jgi:cytochrome c biogenesis protein ResB
MKYKGQIVLYMFVWLFVCVCVCVCGFIMSAVIQRFRKIWLKHLRRAKKLRHRRVSRLGELWEFRSTMSFLHYELLYFLPRNQHGFNEKQ